MFLTLVLQLVGGIMKVVNLYGKRYNKLTLQWSDAYNHVIKAFRELGYTVHLDPELQLEEVSEFAEVGFDHSDEAIYVYNHTYLDQVKKDRLPTGTKTFFIKPTAPASNYFTIYPLGYACSSSIAYEKPNFEGIKTKAFFNSVVNSLLAKREHKWTVTGEVIFDCATVDLPEDHILVIGQMPGDETVNGFSFGNHWLKLQSIVNYLKDRNTVVLKLHPTFKPVITKAGKWPDFNRMLLQWRAEGVTIYEDQESLHDILPKTNIAIVENTTAGIECLMYKIPMISYGLPEYHWVTKDLRHLNMLQSYIDDTSWWDPQKADEWLTWYCTKYQCHNYASTFNRLEELCSEETQ